MVNFSIYSVSKVVVCSLVCFWVLEVSDCGICINVVSLGLVCILGLGGLVVEVDCQGLFDVLVVGVLFGWLGELEEIGWMVVFLVLDELSFINVVEIYVDGGLV